MPTPYLKNAIKWLSITPKWAWWAIAGTTTLGLINFGAEYSLHQSYDLRFQFLPRLFDELSGTWDLLILLPFILKFFDFKPIDPTNWAKRIPLYLIAMIVAGMAHTGLMTIIRSSLYPVLGFGTYDPGEMLYRFAMETAKFSPGFWFFYFGYLTYTKNKEKQKKALELIALQKELAEAKLESLKNQLNPHFLFNTLNIVSSIMYEDTKKADSLLADLSEFIRYNLSLEDSQTVSLRQEITITQKYIDIMACRFGDRLQVTTQIDSDLNDSQVPVFSIQPLVENAIKFTMESILETGEIEIRAEKENAELRIKVQDNGPGLGASAPGTKTGLKNLRQRLLSLYGDSAQLSLSDASPSGVSCVLTIPLQSESTDASD